MKILNLEMMFIMSHSTGKKAKKTDKTREKMDSVEIVHGKEIKKHKSKEFIEGK